VVPAFLTTRANTKWEEKPVDDRNPKDGTFLSKILYAGVLLGAMFIGGKIGFLVKMWLMHR
jgi:hypothetical protein